MRIGELATHARGGPKVGWKRIPAQSLVFSEEAEWKAFWERYDIEGMPKVDFGRHQVAVLFLGDRPSVDCRVEIVAVERGKAGDTVIRAVEHQPKRRQSLDETSDPAAMVVFDRQPGPFRFEVAKAR